MKIRLRRVNQKSLFNIYKLLSDESVVKYALFNRHESIYDTHQFIKKLSDLNCQTHYSIFSEGKFVGICNIKKMPDKFHTLFSIGYYILPSMQGKGLATITAKELMKICFVKYEADFVFATCDPNNSSSEKVMKRIGMNFHGQLNSHAIKENGEMRDSKLYILSRESYFKIPK